MNHNRKTVLWRRFDPSLILGAVCTVAFYAFVHQPAMRDTMLSRYTTEHAVEYVIVALFIWGLCDIFLKLLCFPKEIWALRQDWLPARAGREPAANASTLLNQIHTRRRWLQESRVGRRLASALDYVKEKGSADEYREHLQYLSDQDADATHSSYMLIRFVIAVTPVLGFLGTVVHFGTALSGFSFEEMAERLPVIVGEMGAAFNTTTVALAAAMTTMFALFVCDRVEGSIGRSIDRLVERELLNRFEARDPNVVPFLALLQTANQEALGAISTTLERQIEVWSQTLGSLFERFDARQQQEAQHWHAALEVLQQRHEAYDAAREERMRQTIALLESRQDQHMDRIQTTLDRVAAFRGDFAVLAKTLDSLARGEGKLVELQAVLTDNLRVLHETQQFDDALHELTAAIHLLTGRYRLGGTRDAAAA